ncbi:MAG: damage-control phosphatase ARMT1 family protein [Candidatus Helarchaeota archaeon]
MTEPKLWTIPECVTCLATIALELLQRGTEDRSRQIGGMKQVYKLLQKFSMEVPPTDIANEMYKLIQEITGQIDLFQEIKRRSNEVAKKALGKVYNHVQTGRNKAERFRRSVAAAIMGNLIDFGTAGHSIELDPSFFQQCYIQILEEGFAIDNLVELQRVLNESTRILYLADNAGEIYFDWILLHEIQAQWKNSQLILVVKGAPISNDATLEDVQDPIFTQVVDRIITTGSRSLGVSLTKNSSEFLEELRKADCILAKGQSNFETLYYYHQDLTKRPIFFLFRTKCSAIAQFLGLAIGCNIVLAKCS